MPVKETLHFVFDQNHVLRHWFWVAEFARDYCLKRSGFYHGTRRDFVESGGDAEVSQIERLTRRIKKRVK